MEKKHTTHHAAPHKEEPKVHKEEVKTYVPLTVDQLKSRGAAVGLYSNFTEADVLALELQARAAALGLSPTASEAEVIAAESKQSK